MAERNYPCDSLINAYFGRLESGREMGRWQMGHLRTLSGSVLQHDGRGGAGRHSDEGYTVVQVLI